MSLTKEDVREVIDQALGDHWMDIETHRTHHQAVQLWLQQQEERRQRWQRIRDQLVGTALLSALAGILGALGYACIQWVKDITSRGGQ